MEKEMTTDSRILTRVRSDLATKLPPSPIIAKV